MKKKVAISQSNYIPWKGYFDMIALVDEFILYDEMQYTRRDWRNRNLLKTNTGIQWLTVPVKVKGRYHQLIAETEISDARWGVKHWKTLCGHYKSAVYFKEIASLLEPIYLGREFTFLSELNRTLIESVCGYLEITTKISNSSDYQLSGGKTEKLANLCDQAGGAEYVSGPSAREYLNETVFRTHNIALTWLDYSGYPEYPQLWGGFVGEVSILDLLFNCGKDSSNYMKYVKR